MREDRLTIHVWSFRAVLTRTGPNEVTATFCHYRGASDVIRAAWEWLQGYLPGTETVLTVDGMDVPCTVTGYDEQAWTVTVEVD